MPMLSNMRSHLLLAHRPPPVPEEQVIVVDEPATAAAADVSPSAEEITQETVEQEVEDARRGD